ncbi:chromatin structure-remodeling complex subunit RSC7 [Savitreella phatthalungensis]
MARRSSRRTSTRGVSYAIEPIVDDALISASPDNLDTPEPEERDDGDDTPMLEAHEQEDEVEDEGNDSGLQNNDHAYDEDAANEAEAEALLEEEDADRSDDDDNGLEATAAGGDEDEQDGNDEEEEEEEEDDNDTENTPSRPASTTPASAPRRRGRPAKRGRWRISKIAGDDSDADSTTPRRRLAGGGIPRSERLSANVVPQDVATEPFQVDNATEEIILNRHDPEGETKVDQNGFLLDGREYRVRTFTVAGRGQRLYMLSTEPARCAGYRDSYLFFIRHRTLHKVVLDDAEKDDMIARDLIPASYRTRQIAVVTARSVFRDFGAKIVVGGKRITDDYWVAEYRKLGYTDGELADPLDAVPRHGLPYNKDQYVAWHGGTLLYSQANATPFERTTRSRRGGAGAVPDVTWLLDQANNAMAFNQELTAMRRTNALGVYEPHTNVNFVPDTFQPSRCVWFPVPKKRRMQHEDGVQTADAVDSPGKLTVDLEMQIRPSTGTASRMSDIDDALLALVTPEVRAAIEAKRQQEREESDSLIYAGYV